MGKAQTVDPMECEEFLKLIREGVGELSAGLEVGWTPDRTRKMCDDEHFAQLMFDAREMLLEDLEAVLLAKAKVGNRWAMEIMLFCKGKHRGWVPPAQKIQVHHRSEIEHRVVLTAVQAAKVLMQSSDPADLQKLAAIEVTATDADQG